MTAPSPLLAASTERLAAALCQDRDCCEEGCYAGLRSARFLIESGAVVPAASLADDEAAASAIRDANVEWFEVTEARAAGSGMYALRALADALEDR